MTTPQDVSDRAAIAQQKAIAQVDRAFTYHAPNPNDVPVLSLLREKARGLALMIVKSVPEGRERSLAMTKLEETIMWANAGIVRPPV